MFGEAFQEQSFHSHEKLHQITATLLFIGFIDFSYLCYTITSTTRSVAIMNDKFLQS